MCPHLGPHGLVREADDVRPTGGAATKANRRRRRRVRVGQSPHGHLVPADGARRSGGDPAGRGTHVEGQERVVGRDDAAEGRRGGGGAARGVAAGPAVGRRADDARGVPGTLGSAAKNKCENVPIIISSFY